MSNGTPRATSGCAAGGSPVSGPDAGDLFLPWHGRTPVYAILENVRSLFNVGAVFRSADGVRAAGVYLAGYTGAPPRREIARVALGAERWVPWRRVRRAAEAVEMLRGRGVTVYALENTGESADYRCVAFRFPAAFVVGHEVEGIGADTIAVCTDVVHLPMRGEKTSLNVSVAAGVMLYHLMSRAPAVPP